VAQGVVWTGLVNATVVPLANGTVSLTKTAGCDGCEDAGAVSTQAIVSGDGYAQFTVGEATTYWYAGLTHAILGTKGAGIDFAVLFNGAGSVNVQQNDVYQGGDSSYAAGDVFRVAVEKGVVTFRKNGIVFFSSTKAPTYRLFLASTLGSLGTHVNGAVISGALGTH
jgi:hypothetical protein